jgi:hypothetical protein
MALTDEPRAGAPLSFLINEVRFWRKADINLASGYVRFEGKADFQKAETNGPIL